MKPHPNHPKFNQKRFKDRDLTIDEHFIIDEYGQQVMGDWENTHDEKTCRHPQRQR